MSHEQPEFSLPDPLAQLACPNAPTAEIEGMIAETIRQILSEIVELLETGREESSVTVRDALCGSEETLERFLESNELCGEAPASSRIVPLSTTRRRAKCLRVY
ncbi:MAG: hypothetical protein HYX25_10315 [Candidatus Solibacter usitatus]|nr:hypothetical protein [Candidatus Solibacter usitatus]